MHTRPTRREFLGATAATAAATWAGGKLYAAGADAGAGPNETINLGLIGCGGEGRSVLAAHVLCPGTRAVAVCDLHEARLAQARQDFGGEKVLAYDDYRKLLENDDVDAVIVGTNDHWHVLPTIDACRAGKDVYLEKPVGTSIGEGRAAVEAARKCDRVVQVGTQQQSWPHYGQAREAIQSGRLGEISEVKVWDMDYLYPGPGCPPDGDPPKELDWDFWIGPSPEAPYNPNRYGYHYWWFDYGGGWQVDWAVHHYDIVHWCMGVTAPTSATAMGDFLCYEKTNVQWPDTFSGICRYGPGPVSKKGFLLQYTFRGGCRREHRSHAKCFFGTEASLLLDRGGYTIYAEARGDKDLGEPIETVRNELSNEPPGTHIKSLQAHAQVFLDCVRSRKRPAADIEVGHRASNPGHLLNIAWKVGRQIAWDAEKEQVIGDQQANALVTKQYRAPWKLEV